LKFVTSAEYASQAQHFDQVVQISILLAMADPINNLRAAYRVLEDRVIRSLRTQLGDAVRLGEQRAQAMQFLQAAEQVSLALC